MSDVLQAKFISSYHSSGEEVDVPELFYRYNQQSLNVYNRKEQNNLISTVTTEDLANIADEKHLVIQNVLEATFRKKPLLVIVTTTIKSTNESLEPRIYVFWHRVFEGDTRLVHFDLPMMGEISVIAMTSQPVVLLKNSSREIPKQRRIRHLLAFAKRDQSLQVASLDDDRSKDGKPIRGKVIEVKLPSQVPGDITAIQILPQSTTEHRLGYGDPRIFVGTSGGYIQVLRFKAYSRIPTTSIIVLEGYTWRDLMKKGGSNTPITCLTSKRARHNQQVMTVIAQEQKYNTLHDNHGGDDDIDHSSNENSDNASLRVIEWLGNFSRRVLDPLTPTKLTSYTLSSTRIIPTPDNYQVTAIFRSTHDKQHFELDVWIIEKGVARLVLADEIFGRNIGSIPEDVWPIYDTTRYVRLDLTSAPIEVDSSNTDAKLTRKAIKFDLPHPRNIELETHSTGNTETTDAQGESHDTTTNDQKEIIVEPVNDSDILVAPNDYDESESANNSDILMAPNEYYENEPENDTDISTAPNEYDESKPANNSDILTTPDEYDESEPVANSKDSTETIDNDTFNYNFNKLTPPTENDDEERIDRILAVDKNNDLQSQPTDDYDANVGLDYDFSTNNIPDSNIVTNGDNNGEIKTNHSVEPVVDTQHEQPMMDHPYAEKKTIDTHVTDPSIVSNDERNTTTIEEDTLDFQDTCENFNSNSENQHFTMNQEKPTIALIDDTVISETTRKMLDSGIASNSLDHHHTKNDTTYDNHTTSIDNDIILDSHTTEIDNDVHSHMAEGNKITTTSANVGNDVHPDIAEGNKVTTTTTTIDNNDLFKSDATPQMNEPYSYELTSQYTLSSTSIPIVSSNEVDSIDYLCKLEKNATGLGSNNTFATISSETAPSPTTSQLDDVKPLSSEQTIDVAAKEPEPPSPTMIYELKVKEISKSSLSDGLDMVRNDKSTELNQRERLNVLFDIIFSMARMTTSPNTKNLDINNAMKLLKSLPLDATEQDALMHYCFNNENPVLKLVILNYNIDHGNFGLVLMQQKMMKLMGNSRISQQNSSHSTDGVDHLEKTTLAIERTCDNLAKLSQDMVSPILQDLPLEIFGRARGKVGNPFVNEENSSSLLQEKGLGLGAEALVQVMKSRKRRRLD